MMIDEREAAADGGHVWLVFGDLMAGLMGLFVLFFVVAVWFQVDLTAELEAEQAARAVAADRLEVERAARAETDARLAALEAALAAPLAAGRITLEDGRIGIAGSVLFDLYSAELRDEGAALLREIGPPLAAWLVEQQQMVMVGGFTDDLPIHGARRLFADNWQLSTERALVVVRGLVEQSVPPERLFAAGFGAHHPAVPNVDEASRARNRRVEIVPVPQGQPARAQGATPTEGGTR